MSQLSHCVDVHSRHRSSLYTPESARVVAKAAEQTLRQPHTVTTPAAVSRSSRQDARPAVTASSSRLEAKRQRRAVNYSGPCIIYNLSLGKLEEDLERMMGKPKRARGRPRRK